MNFIIFLLFSIAGFTLKIGDDLIDEYNKGLAANIPLIISAIMFGFLIRINEDTAAIITSIILGVLFSKKIDSYQFQIGVIISYSIPLIFGIQYVIQLVNIILILFIFTTSAILDEFGDALSEKKNTMYILKYRPFMKIAAVISAMLAIISIDAAIGFLLFDFWYIIATYLSIYLNSIFVKQHHER